MAALLFGALGRVVADGPVDFVRDVRPIFEKHCYSCHGATEQESGLRLDVKQAALKGGDDHGPDIVPGQPDTSALIRFINSDDEDSRMPPDGKMSNAEIATLTRWIVEGAVWPDGVDRVKLTDARDHWSFKPLSLVPQSASSQPSESIDTFIVAKLKENSLALSPETDRVSWLRRVSFDLIGLPPSPEQVRAFTRDQRADAFERVVEELLGSERYGERWAQHWLDVVRYADTHGFEVNTERPNAWPYRDYVIRSFNNDTRYDQFIQEQIVGDALGQDAGTGFLVTASVLLPGQIGKDEASIRLARQDSLDEIVNNIGQTFLGLSVGCARCHDHKFDPITAKDYYAMQAFVAGVEYEDRELRSEESEARKWAVAPLKQQVQAANEQLAKLIPFAQPGTVRRITNAKENTESFDSIEAKLVRFTIHDSNLHPTLGLIEPCIDEFEIWTDEQEPRNIALASSGTNATASGSNESDLHKLVHINDGQTGNARSWMASTKGRGWVQFELPQATKISKIVWSRDRTGQFSDRLPTSFTLEAGPASDSLTKVAESAPLRPTAGAGPLNIDRIHPVRASRLRFKILNTNSLEPCLDELEVLNTAGTNIALASLGCKVTTSGNTVVPNRHQTNFINDGQYGNERSWMSNEPGKGWVELEFSEPQEIDRVLWSRDRSGKFLDRLPIEYAIEVHVDDKWLLVADSTDRQPHIAGLSRGPEFTLAGLSPIDAAQANALLKQKAELEKQIQLAEMGQQVFAGKFRAPDEIRLLNRGDPEQPKEEVLPSIISALGEVQLSKESPEQERRRSLADWIASPQNPLTARVMVNRIWQGHFGIGLVDTPSDFGNNGMTPTHPELLDWLASEFIRSGWSIKQMHRRIVLSATYRQSSRLDASNAGSTADAEARLLWRFPSRRLEAESLRDSMLSVSGLLNTKMYGRGFDMFDKRGGLSGFAPIEKLATDNQRRMIYAHKIRRETEAVFGAFDCPDAGQSTALRRHSTTPIQALNLLNSRFTLDVSKAFSERVVREAGSKIEEQIQHAYQLALNRNATLDELKESEPIVRGHGLELLCRVLFNCNEFLFVP
ncbi:MAG: DUF1553 domain-containing protein [Planctomycetota bacterium]|nr:DUF1553 domain-containing protein [Planctomycetota bacterium]